MLFVPIAAPPVILQTHNPYSAFYRSSDQKTIGGVCAGLAHKWGVNNGGVQIGFVLLSIFFLLGPLAYIICWAAFKPLPTLGIKPP
jgi:phage shock protein PspC (stress-responsive transcriptional regulator)